MIYSHAVFDLDGVIIDTEADVQAFWCDIAKKDGLELTQDDLARHVFGCKADLTMDRLFSHFSEAKRQRVLREMEKIESSIKYRAIKGSLEFIGKLRENGIKIALVTSAYVYKINTVFDQLGLNSTFDVVVSGEDIAKGKPHPECYILAAKKLGVSPDQCVVFEDAISGMQSAYAAKCHCIGINKVESYLLKEGAAFVAEDFCDERLPRLFNIE